MTHEIKKLPKSEIEILITVSEEEMQKHTEKAAVQISKDVKVKGFRPGHVPMDVLKQQVGETKIEAYAQELAIQKTFVDVILQEKIQTVSRPKITVESQKPFTFKAIVAVMPEIELKDHKSIKVKIEEAKVTDKDLKEFLDKVKKDNQSYEETEEKAKKGDRVEVDFEGFDEDGKSVENTKSSNHPLVLGDGMMVPGFEEELIGLKKADKKEFTIVFPKDYFKKDFQNKKLKFKVEIKKVEQAVEAELNEELIEKLTGKKQNIDEFKKDVKENLQKQKEHENKQKAENEYIEQLIKKLTIEIPGSLIHEEQHNIIHEVKHNIESRGMKFEDYLKQVNTTEQKLEEKYKDEAEKRVKTRLALQKAIELEEIKVEDKEIDEEIAKIKSFYPESEHAKIQEDVDSGRLRPEINNRLILRKFFAKVL